VEDPVGHRTTTSPLITTLWEPYMPKVVSEARLPPSPIQQAKFTEFKFALDDVTKKTSVLDIIA
jgi:hypothetical protein